MRNIILFISILFLFKANAQFQLENWQSYTYLRDIRQACADKDNNIWAAGSGGILKYDLNSDNYEVFTNVDELIAVDFNTIFYSFENDILIAGSSDGIIEIYKDGQWLHNSDIKNSVSSANISVNDIVIEDNFAYIGGNFGLAVFDFENNIFVEDIKKFGNLTQISVNKIVAYKGNIWAATDKGVVTADLETIISNPDNWTAYTQENGLTENSITDISIAQDSVYATDSEYLFQLRDTVFTIVEEKNIVGIETINDTLYYSNPFRYYRYNPTKNFDITDNIITGFNACASGQIDAVFYLRNNGFGVLRNDSLEMTDLNSPATGIMYDIAVEEDGAVWFATGQDEEGRGAMKLEDGIWTNFNANEQSSYPGTIKGIHKVNIQPDGRKLFSCWGAGLMTLREADTGYVFNLYNDQNSTFDIVNDIDDFVVAGETKIDNNGITWCPNYSGPGFTGNALIAMDQNNEFYGFQNMTSPTIRGYIHLAIDFNGTKWLGSYSNLSSGLMYYNENNTLEDKSDDINGIIRSSDSPELLSNSMTALAVDDLGLLWIGMINGISVLLNPEAVVFDNQLIFRKIDFLENVKVNDIMIDNINRKWIATSDGIWVLNEDGNEIVAQINSSNTPLPTDNIISLAMNDNTGEVYFGTNQGLYSAFSLAAAPLESYDLFCYPQPFDPQKDGNIVIDGLAENSYIKIVTTSGELITDFRAKGKKTLWNGRDDENQLVSTGIYLIIAESVSTNASSVAKIAIVRD